ncbi:hypothetical protein D5R93_05820 [Actinomyces lilanjuaniae]|uniref:Bro-N domain-containing protein n=1 Tax=Actinomyces lilanjuaniae TaxID=2321394 RepID=A0ABN5PRJ6_9ACTO|nr:BRO family protein [Actinomyces lilanjuaniae]AYD89687.1 hypothetical protein D5R93_05820 [Actinomyces lilanjuaniae]
MTTEITPFTYEDTQVRVITDTDGALWFVAKDVCDILGTATRDLRKILDEDELTNTDTIHIGEIATENGGRAPLLVSESGLYSLVLRSRRPEARPFRRWVTHEVLPSIRKHGGYISPTATGDQADDLLRRSRAQIDLLQAARGLVHADHLEARARVVLARGLGEAPDIDPARRPLYVQDFLRSISNGQVRKVYAYTETDRDLLDQVWTATKETAA